MKKTGLIFLCALNMLLHGQTQKQYNSAGIIQSLKKLNTVGSVLYIAAHPDDENTRLLAYLANEKKLNAAYLSLTRGDGGQNLIGKEQGESLGLIRTNELLAARGVDGAQQFFTRANDFGYSKDPEETFGIWNKDSVLSDVVWVIRKFKPDVIICRFPTTGEGGHGHHTASAILAEEAFDAAADSTRFPEQLKYVQVWKTKRLFWNTFNFGSTNTTSEDQLKVDVGVYNPLLGKYYGEIAAESRSMHKSQGFGSAKVRGSTIEYFKLLKGDQATKDLFEGVDNSWKRFKEIEKFDKLITSCINKYNPQLPENSVKELVQLYKELNKVEPKNSDANYYIKIKRAELENIIVACSGIWAEAYAKDYIGIPTQPVSINAQIIESTTVPVKLNKISLYQNHNATPPLEGLILNGIGTTLKQNELNKFESEQVLSGTLAYSNPYWLNDKHTAGLYTVKNQMLRGLPKNPPELEVVYSVAIFDQEFNLSRPLAYKYTDPVKGEIYRPYEVLPPATVNIASKVYVFSDEQPKTIKLLVKANADNVKGSVKLNVPSQWNVKADNLLFDLKKKGDEKIIEVTVNSDQGYSNSKLNASLLIDGNEYNRSIQRIEYDHIPYQFILSEATAQLVKLDLKKTGSSIGYIPGAGDEVQSCLKEIGYNVTELTDEMMTSGDLSKFDAIVTGIRAYNVNERLQVHYDKLMNYVKNGGNLIVQYNTNSRVGPVNAVIGPYPFTVTRNRVTDENAKVTFIDEKNPVLNFPNKITQSDFDGWIQERGIYFAGELDKEYKTVFSMNDPKEEPLDGSLITARYGKGNFVYTGLAFFRELPAGVTGAYRLFVNLLSIPKNVEQK